MLIILYHSLLEEFSTKTTFYSIDNDIMLTINY